MRLRIVRDVDVPPEALEAWWSDLREGSADHAFLGSDAPVWRRLRRLDDAVVRVEDEGRFFGMPLLERYDVRREPGRVVLEGANNFSIFRATYDFEATSAGTRVTLEATLAPIGLLALLDPLGRPFVRRFLTRDLEGHLADARRDLQPGGGSPP
ncbi:MAG TPA: SRPBCC family protein [Candidatus Thermoplasmatota archaeon]|nr:SRPBCC family protein [Candidatus Thermoplasmatota archaeon]